MRTALLLVLLCAAPARADDADVWAQRATATHKEAQKTQDPKKYEEAAGYYAKYFAHPDDKEAAMAFYYGELLFKMQRYADAAKMYDRNITLEPKGQFAKEAAYAFMISTKNAVTTPPESADRPPTCPPPKPCPIPDDLQRLLGAFDRFEAIVPESPQRVNVEYRRAKLYHEYNHFAEAAPRFDHVFTAYPGNELGTYAANLEMDCLVYLKRWSELRALVERVKKSPIMSDATTQKQVRDVEAELKKQRK